MTSPPWADDNSIAQLFAAISTAGGTVRLVGGCVRDWLSGQVIGDYDLATDLEPQRTTAALEAKGIRVIPTGIGHGTVSALIDGRTFEITTLRHDLETDGRHATVGFTTDWIEDARRRDFTVNALYADLDGTIHDPTEWGRTDLGNRLLRFVGDPADRIREDYLRILRFHRFAAQTGFRQDETGLSACAALASGMSRLSAERIWQEMKRLFSGAFRWPVIQQMAKDGVLDVILPEAVLEDWLEELPSGAPLLFLAALAQSKTEEVAVRWKLSGKETARLRNAVPQGNEASLTEDELRRVAWRSGSQAAIDRLVIDAAQSGQDASPGVNMLQSWKPPQFPLKGQDALDLGMLPGPDVGRALATVEEWWIAEGFAPDRTQCLGELKRLAGRS